MRNIEIMLADGMIGPKSVLLALSSFATGNLNSKIRRDATPFKMDDLLPFAHEYVQPPLTEEQKQAKSQRSLMAFMAMNPKAPKKILEAV